MCMEPEPILLPCSCYHLGRHKAKVPVRVCHLQWARTDSQLSMLSNIWVTELHSAHLRDTSSVFMAQNPLQLGTEVLWLFQAWCFYQLFVFFACCSPYLPNTSAGCAGGLISTGLEFGTYKQHPKRDTTKCFLVNFFLKIFP
jgi:hypothetical protein